jgi:hypothetical protein
MGNSGKDGQVAIRKLIKGQVYCGGPASSEDNTESVITEFLRLAAGNIRSAIAQTMAHPGECSLEFEFPAGFEHRGVKMRVTTEGFLNIDQNRCSDLWSSKAPMITGSLSIPPNLARSTKRALGVCKSALPPLLEKERKDAGTTRILLVFKSGELIACDITKRNNFDAKH